jgi:hypothetical protein
MQLATTLLTLHSSEESLTSPVTHRSSLVPQASFNVPLAQLLTPQLLEAITASGWARHTILQGHTDALTLTRFAKSLVTPSGPPCLRNKPLPVSHSWRVNSYLTHLTYPPPTPERHVFSALTTKDARALYGDTLIKEASIAEINNCIEKDVWECMDPFFHAKGVIPSKMFLTPKKLPNGDIDKIKGRVVAGGH